MMLNRFFPIIIPLLIFLLEQAYFFSPKLIFVAMVLIVLLIFFTVWQFCRSSKTDKQWWNYLILPGLMSLSIIAYSVFISNRSIIQSLFILNIIFLYIYFRQVYYYLLNPPAYKAFSIENISSYVNWLTFFLSAAAIYGLGSFLSLTFAWLVVIMLGITGLLVYQMTWADKIKLSLGLPYILISCLIMVELFWSISFLPFNYNISGLSLAICYYAVIGLVKNHLLSKLDAAKVKMYLLVGVVSLFLVLLTARWM